LAISLNGCIFNKSVDDLVIVFNEITGSTKDSVIYNVKENSYHLTKNSNVEITLKNMSSKDLVTRIIIGSKNTMKAIGKTSHFMRNLKT